MKSNKKLVILIIFLVTILMLLSGLTLFLSQDETGTVKKAFENLDAHSFNSMDIEIKEGEYVVFSDIKGAIKNPLELDYSKKDYQDINLDYKAIKGRKILEGNVVKVDGTVEDSVAMLGREVENLQVKYNVDKEKLKVTYVKLSYVENGYDVSIVLYNREI